MTADSLFAAARKQFSLKEIATLLRIQYGTVDRWVRKNTVPPFYRNDLMRVLKMKNSFDIGIKESDQFYTMPKVANQCVKNFNKTIAKYHANTRSYTYIEPSAGCGHFYDLLPPTRRIGIDIDPQPSPIKNKKEKRIIAADFLTWHPKTEKRYVVIGNPPFGRNGKTALDFMFKAFEFADYVGFILPPIFNSTGKGSCRNRLTKAGHALLLHKELGDTSFVCPDGRNVGIKTVFQVWAKQKPKWYREIVMPTCDDFVDIHNIYISPRESRPSSNTNLAGKCDIYLPRSFWGSKEVRSTFDFADIPYKDGWGIIVKKQKRDVINFIKRFDWREVAHISTNGSMSLRRDIIRDQLVKAGFSDKVL